MNRIKILVTVLSMASSSMAAAQREPVPAPPPIPTPEERARAAAEENEAEAQPRPIDEVTERVEGNRIITEYRRRGQLYMVKIKPKNGPAQYWMDRDGDGQFQPHDTDINEDVNLPKWKIGNW